VCYTARSTPLCDRHLGLDIWLGAANVLLQLQKVRRELDVVLEVILRVKVVCGFVASVLLDVQADGGAAAASTRETNDDAAAIVELDVDTLLLADAAIEIGV
jgi:hypothetical protein